ARRDGETVEVVVEMAIVVEVVTEEEVREGFKDHFPTQTGKVNGTEVTVLRDTDANCVIFGSRLRITVYWQPALGEVYCSTQRYCKEAVIDVETPYFIGHVLANGMTSPLYHLVLGNIEGVKGQAKVQDTVQAVQTRVQTRQEEKRYRKLNVPDPILHISRDYFLKLQKEDISLRSVHNIAREGQMKSYKNGGTVTFVSKNGLLYRKYTHLTERRNDR
ncbi:LOW QUALITY PROTEIN: hypothetical protein MAR_034936, partial [Mya arenaria]